MVVSGIFLSLYFVTYSTFDLNFLYVQKPIDLSIWYKLHLEQTRRSEKNCFIMHLHESKKV